MSESQREVVRRWAEGVVDAVSRGDEDDLGDLSMLDPEIVYEDEILPDHAGETYHGHDGFRRAWARALEPWESIDARLEWVRDAADDAVVSCHFGRLRGRGSGIEAEIRYAYLWRFRPGTDVVVYCKSYPDPDAALEAAR